MKLIVIYGPPAAGKYTIAKCLMEKTGYKLFHNHLMVDLLKSVFQYGTPDFFRLSQKIRLEIFEEAAKQNVPGIIFTFVYAKDEDDLFIQTLQNVLTPYEVEITFIQLYCEKAELLKRVTAESRHQFQKINSTTGLLEMLNVDEVTSPIAFVKSTRIDNTHLSVEAATDQVMLALEINPEK